MRTNTFDLLKKTLALFMREALGTPWMRVRCVIALLLIGVDVISTSLVAYYSKQIVNTLPLQWGSALWISLALFGGFWILETVVSHVQDITFFPILNQTTRNLTYRTVKHLHQIPLLAYQQLSIPETINGIRRISQSARSFVKTIVLTLIPSALKILVAAFVLAKTSALAMVFLPCMGVLFFLLYKITAWYTQARARAWQMSDQMILRIHDSLLNTERCRFFQTQEMETIAKNLDREAACWQQTNRRLHTIHILMGILLGLTLTGTLGGIILALRPQYAHSLGDFIFVQAQLMAALIPFRHFSREFRQIAEGLVDIEKVIRLLAIPLEPPKMPYNASHSSKSAFIEVQNLSFSYDAHRIFDEISLQIPIGSKIGIVGKNGVGKSTLLKLISGLYTPQKGSVSIYGKAIHRYKKENLQKIMHYVPQHHHLFNASLRLNLCQGLREDFEDRALLDALEKVQLLTLLEQLPEGLDTPVGEMGTKLSGGEQQKVALARALLLKPSILLLDETTNALSLADEQSILATLFHTIPSIILSSHRSSVHSLLETIFQIDPHTASIKPLERSFAPHDTQHERFQHA